MYISRSADYGISVGPKTSTSKSTISKSSLEVIVSYNPQRKGVYIGQLTPELRDPDSYLDVLSIANFMPILVRNSPFSNECILEKLRGLDHNTLRQPSAGQHG